MNLPILTSWKKKLQARLGVIRKVVADRVEGKKRSRRWMKGMYFVLGMMLAAFGLVIGGLFYYSNRALPGVRVAKIDVSGMPTAAIEGVLQEALITYRSHWPVTLSGGGEERLLTLDELGVTFDLKQTAQEAVRYGKRQGLAETVVQAVMLWRTGVDLPIIFEVDEEAVSALTTSIVGGVDREYVPATITVLPTGKILAADQVLVDAGSLGQRLDHGAWRQQLIDSLTYWVPMKTELPIASVGEVPTAVEIEETKRVVTRLGGATLTISYASQSAEPKEWTLLGNDLIGFWQVKGGFSQEKVMDYVSSVALSVNSPAQNAKFNFNQETQRVEEFLAAKPGLIVDVDESTTRILQALERVVEEKVVTIELAVGVTEPDLTLDEVNDLGIKELLGKGTSTYRGSIPSRVHNLALAAARANGTLVPPGEEFSLAKAVGEISKATGYKEAYVIFQGKTELGDGGGVCQDSTTMFRAALDAGLPIVERRPHSYRVSYYEQNSKPGMDATVYPPSPDFRFLNDTPAHILVQASADTENYTVTFELYGTSDGRKSEITNHVVYDLSPPPPDVWVDDPTLPSGQVKEIEHAIGGAKAKFDYTVTRGEEVLIEETFYSVYKPWAAVYLRGTGPN